MSLETWGIGVALLGIGQISMSVNKNGYGMFYVGCGVAVIILGVIDTLSSVVLG